ADVGDDDGSGLGVGGVTYLVFDPAVLSGGWVCEGHVVLLFLVAGAKAPSTFPTSGACFFLLGSLLDLLGTVGAPLAFPAPHPRPVFGVCACLRCFRRDRCWACK